MIYAEIAEQPETWNVGWNASTGNETSWDHSTVYWGYEGKYTDDNGLTYRLFSNKTASIISCDKSITGNLVIPSEINGYCVTQIMFGVFAEITELKNVYIPKSITRIDDLVFFGCNPNTKIYAEAVSRPLHWAFSWNAYAYINFGTAYKNLEVIWGCTLSDFPIE